MWLFISIFGCWFTISLLLAVIVGRALKRRGEMTSEIDPPSHAARQRTREAA
jgi:hypothetical protein